MKILVLSDSHAGRSFMRLCIRAVQPNAIVHLGDYYADAEVMAEEFPEISMYQVPGNCDRGRGFFPDPETRVLKICGVQLFLTHGHLHDVKRILYSLVKDAEAAGVQAVLYGHTHQADCHREGQLWVLNPGSCGVYGGSAGLMEVENGQILDCRILRQEDLDL